MGENGKGRDGGSKPRTPLHVEEQSEPEPERLQRPAEEAGMAPHQREEPPQAEGDRDDGDAAEPDAEDRGGPG